MQTFVFVPIHWFCTEKYWWVIFDKDLYFTKNYAFYLKNENFQKFQLGLTVFPEILHMCCTLQMLKTCVWILFCFNFVLFSYPPI